jgi:8-oxo-dGTP pyrophosphatase MutT (NUDIX family)
MIVNPYAGAVSLQLRLRRIAYRGVHTVLRGYWFVRRPRVEGVKCVLTAGDQVLLVRHTYGHREWDLPGGAAKRSEDPLATARREMREELGIDVDDWKPLGQVFGTDYHRVDAMHCFHADLRHAELTFDRGEIAAAGWFDRRRLPAELSPRVPEILARVDGHP